MNNGFPFIPLALSAILCLPVTGFIYGFFACTGCGSGISGLLGRVFIGIIAVFNTVFTLGAPYDNEGGTSSTNIRPYVLLTFVLLFLLFFVLQSYKSYKLQ